MQKTGIPTDINNGGHLLLSETCKPNNDIDEFKEVNDNKVIEEMNSSANSAPVVQATPTTKLDGSLSGTLEQDDLNGESDNAMSQTTPTKRDGSLSGTLEQDDLKGESDTAMSQTTPPTKRDGSLSGTLEQDDLKGESDNAMSQKSSLIQNNLQQRGKGTLRKRQSKRRVFTGDDTNVPCSLLSYKQQKRILQWQSSRLRFDDLVKESLKGPSTKETQSGVTDGDQIQADRNTAQTDTKETIENRQIQAEIYLETTIGEKAVTKNDSTVEGTEEKQDSGYLSSTNNREINVSLNRSSTYFPILNKELKMSRDEMAEILKDKKKMKVNARYLMMKEEQYLIVEKEEALLLKAIELAVSKLSKQKADIVTVFVLTIVAACQSCREKRLDNTVQNYRIDEEKVADRNARSTLSSGYVEMEQWQERDSFKPFYGVDPFGDKCLCCLTDPIETKIGLSLIHCDILDALDVPPVVDMFEILLSHIVQLSSNPVEHNTGTSGMWVAIPYSRFHVQDWQEACLMELVEDRVWFDSQAKFRLNKRYVDQVDTPSTEMHFVEFLINEKKTLAVVGRPRIDIAVVESQNVMITSSTDDRIRMTVPASRDGTTKAVHLQVVPILPRMIADFQTTYKCHDDDLDHNLDEFSLLGCSPFITLKITDKSKESLSFTFPCRSQSPRPDSGIVLSSRSSPRSLDPTTYYKLRPMTSDSSLPRFPPESLSSHAMMSFLAGADQSDIHLVYLNNGTTTKMKTLDKPRDGQFATCSIYEKHARFFALETEQDMKSTKVEVLATSFAEFITTKPVNVQVIQNVDSRTVLLYMLPSQNSNKSEIRKQDGIITSTHQIRLEEGSTLCWKIRGNLAIIQDHVKVFAFHSFVGIKLDFQIEVVNTYTQRSLPTYVGFIQLYSLQGQRRGPLDKWVLPKLDKNWKHLLEIPLTLPKASITHIPTSWKAETSVPNEGRFSVDLLREISAIVSGDWYRLASALDLQHPRIQSIVQQNKAEDRRELAYHILLNWFKRTLKLSDKTDMLITALRRCQKWRLADELEQTNRSYKLEKREILRDIKLKNAITEVCQRPTVFSKWQELSCSLGLSNDDVVAICARAGDDNKSCCFEALCLWTNTARKPTVRKLAVQLRRCQCNVAADYVIQHFA